MDTTYRTYLLEAVGTYLVVLVGAGTLCTTFLNPLSQVGGVTVTCPLVGEAAEALGLILAQLGGAFLAGCSVRFLFIDQVLTDARLGTPHLKAVLATDGSLTLAALTTGFLLEALFTALVTLSVLTTILHPRRPQVGGLIVGLTQVAVILFGFHLTGGAANPARWFGPALWQWSVSGIEAPLAQHAVYWAGPAVGAMLDPVVYSRWIAGPESR